MVHNQVSSICPICGGKCLEDLPFLGEMVIGYDCKKCGDFVLPSLFASFLSLDNNKDNIETHQGTFEKNKTVQVLSNYINKYRAYAKNKEQSVWFYMDNYVKTENKSSGRNFVNLCELYGI